MGAEPMEHVVVGTDFSDGADRALTVAIRFAKLMGAAIDLVHVYPLLTASLASSVPGVFPVPPPGPDVLDEIKRRLDEVSLTVREAGLECRTANPEGSPADEVIAYADRVGAELIVVGTHGRTGLRRVLVGSVAERVLRKTHRPVLVVPSVEENPR